MGLGLIRTIHTLVTNRIDIIKQYVYIRHRKEDNYEQDYWYRFRYN